MKEIKRQNWTFLGSIQCVQEVMGLPEIQEIFLNMRKELFHCESCQTLGLWPKLPRKVVWTI